MSFYFPAAVLALLIALAGCGVEEPVQDAPIARQVIQVVDTIGVEYGDSVYVIGSITALGHTRDGNIAMLDRPSASVRIYSRSGEHLATVAGRGEGPGELASPDAMVLWPCGEISILDNYRGGYFRYDREGSFLNDELRLTSNVHLDITAVGDSDFVAVKSRFLESDGLPQISLFVGRFPFSIEPETVYWETVLTYDPATFADDVLRNYFYMSWAADPATGNVYISPFSETEYRIECFSRDGEMFNVITADSPTLEKTPQEIEREISYVRGWLTALEGGEPDYNVECTPYAYRLPVSGLGVDSSGNIWARRGTDDIPTFDIWTPDGELTGQAVLEGAEGNTANWDFIVDQGGILAFDQDPDDYQRIFIIE